MEKNKLRIITLSVAALFGFIALIMFACPFITIEIGYLSKNITGFKLLFDFEKEYTNGGFGTIAILISFIYTFSGCFGPITALVISIIKELGVELPDSFKIKNKKTLTKEQDKKNKIITNVLWLVVGLIALIFNCCIVDLCGYSDNLYAHIGYGAVLAGILSLISQAVLLFSNSYFGAVLED